MLVVIETITDDFDGSEPASTVPVTYKGYSFEIDLSPEREAELDQKMAPYITHGRRVTNPRSTASVTAQRRLAEAPKIRAWAKANGIAVNDFGFIRRDVVAAYRAAIEAA
ncbi:Lsr2 family protein [Nonomuraea sp. NPDC059023]|uniref:histone-like nucleoid-structuring protein Lsr2 n=1 Tax=unclassified Nonomuraea TaxID=2593643 RepID=UPI0036C03DDE